MHACCLFLIFHLPRYEHEFFQDRCLRLGPKVAEWPRFECDAPLTACIFPRCITRIPFRIWVEDNSTTHRHRPLSMNSFLSALGRGYVFMNLNLNSNLLASDHELYKESNGYISCYVGCPRSHPHVTSPELESFKQYLNIAKAHFHVREDFRTVV